MPNLSKEKLLIIIALILAGVSLMASIVLGLQLLKLKQDLARQSFPTPILTATPTPEVGLSPTQPPTTPISFSQLWQRRDELLGQQVTVKAKVNLLVACPHYEGCCKPDECAATVILGETLGTNYVSIFLHEAGDRITCRWPKKDSNECQDWIKDAQYQITGILGQERVGDKLSSSFKLDVLSKQRL